MDTLILNGHDLTLQDVYDVAYDGRKVEIAADAYARLAKGREIMQELSKGGKAIYGFNRGVGQNKDVTIDEDFMETQNRMMLRSHSLGLPPFNTDEEVRAMMVIRLNNMLIGASCASDDLANSYRDFLNHGITPRIPRRGAVGEADITTITHIGLAFIGEEDVNYKGEVVSAKEAMEKEGLSSSRTPTPSCSPTARARAPRPSLFTRSRISSRCPTASSASIMKASTATSSRCART